MKRLLFLFLFPLTLLSIGYGFFLRTPGFGVYNISSNLKPEKDWEVSPLSFTEKEELEKILSQPFSFLGAGAMSYAFVSADGKMVLKFFRMKNFLPKPWHGKEKNAKRIAKLKQAFTAYKLGYEQLKEESGLIFIHLNRTSDLQKKVKLFDRDGKKHHVDLDSTVFVLQKRAELLYDHLAKVDNQKEALIALFRLIQIRGQKGVVDDDHGVRNNFGFAEGRPIQIDIGRITPCEASRGDAQVELARVAAKIRSWAEISRPEVIPLIDQALQEVMSK